VKDLSFQIPCEVTCVGALCPVSGEVVAFCTGLLWQLAQITVTIFPRRSFLSASETVTMKVTARSKETRSQRRNDESKQIKELQAKVEEFVRAT
jgi:hypothetical protein